MIGARAKDQERVGEILDLMRSENRPRAAGSPSLHSAGQPLWRLRGATARSPCTSSRPTPRPSTPRRAARWGGFRRRCPGVLVRPFPGLEMAEPELRLVPDDQRILEAGWSRSQVAGIVRALGDGLWLGEHFDGARRLDIILRAEDWPTPGGVGGSASQDAVGVGLPARGAGGDGAHGGAE